jgi:hypothetical protein
MQYQVVWSSRANPGKALNELITEVNRMIATGWKPLGGISYMQWSLMSHTYHQAMIHESENKSSDLTG